MGGGCDMGGFPIDDIPTPIDQFDKFRPILFSLGPAGIAVFAGRAVMAENQLRRTETGGDQFSQTQGSRR